MQRDEVKRSLGRTACVSLMQLHLLSEGQAHGSAGAQTPTWWWHTCLRHAGFLEGFLLMDSENRRINWYSVAFCVVFISCLPPYPLMQTLSRLRWFCFELSFVYLSWDKSIQQLWIECLLCTCHYTSVAEGSAVNKADKNLCPHVASVLIRLLQQFIIPTWEALWSHCIREKALQHPPHALHTTPALGERLGSSRTHFFGLAGRQRWM